VIVAWVDINVTLLGPGALSDCWSFLNIVKAASSSVHRISGGCDCVVSDANARHCDRCVNLDESAYHKGRSILPRWQDLVNARRCLLLRERWVWWVVHRITSQYAVIRLPSSRTSQPTTFHPTSSNSTGGLGWVKLNWCKLMTHHYHRSMASSATDRSAQIFCEYIQHASSCGFY
jgi:hypothetical protein